MKAEYSPILLYQEETGNSIYEGLTGVFNHGFFQFMLDREIKRSSRQGTSLSLALINIGGFKGYNQKYGYPAGDRLLMELAKLLLANIRNVDLVARFSGDLFALLLIDSQVGQSRLVAERIQIEAQKRFPDSFHLFIGMSFFPQNALNHQELLQQALESVKKAKMAGGNGIYCFDPSFKKNEQETSTILLVDDDPRNLKLLEAYLLSESTVILKATNGEEALDVVQKQEVDLILLDVMMPGIDGFEVCRRIKNMESTRLIPIVLTTALDDLDSRVKGIENGADDFITKPVNRIEIMARIKSLIKSRKLNNRLTNIENVLFSLANAVEAKDRYTQGHTNRVAHLAVSLGHLMGVSEKEKEALRLGGILHDIGKIGIKESVLNKPGPLDPSEWELMKQHTDIGFRICQPLGKTLGLALEVIRSHHEKLDQSGYPDGLAASQIPLVARIMAVVDIFDALTTDRPYRPAFPSEEALFILKEESQLGKIDGQVVEYLSQMISGPREGKDLLEGRQAYTREEDFNLSL